MGTRTRNFANNILSGGTIDGTDFLSGAVAAPNINNTTATNVSAIPSISNVISPVAGDPPSPTLGDIWYNSSTNALKFQGFTTAAWASGGNYPDQISMESTNGTGTQTASLALGGYTGPVPIASGGGRTSLTAEYDGSSWTNGGSFPTQVGEVGLGATQTAGIVAGYFTNNPLPSNYHANSLDYNGTSWTANNSMPAAAAGVSVIGTQTAAIGFGGNDASDYPNRFAYNKTMDWDGTSWTDTGGNISNKRIGNARAGTSTSAAMMMAGNDYTIGSSPTGVIANTELYDGTTWTSGNNVNTARKNLAGGGTPSLAYIAGGQTPTNTAATEEYDGTSWTSSTNASNARLGTSGANSTRAAGWILGSSPWNNNPAGLMEEFTGSSAITKTFTTD